MSASALDRSAPPALVQACLARQPAGHAMLQPLYNDPAAFAHDMDRIFTRHWLLAGHVSQIPEPGRYILVELATESVILLRDREGMIRAFHNLCRHRGSRILLQPEGKVQALTCPYHAWTYDLTGRLRVARSMPDSFDPAGHGLKPVAIGIAEGLVFISLADQPLDFAPLAEALVKAYRPYGWASARVAHRETYRIAANWKLAVENYLECYHCTPSHPEYSALHALEKPLPEIAAMNEAMEARTRAMGVVVETTDHWVGSETGRPAVFSFRYALYDRVKTGARDGQPVAPLMGDFPDYDGSVTSTHIGPGNFVIAYNDHGVIYRFIPVGPLESAMELIWLVRGDAVEGRDYDLDALTWLWRVTSEADKRITQDNQKGVSSRFYTPGPYAPVEQNAIRWAAWYLKEIA